MRVILYDSSLYEAGGEERLMLEQAYYLKNRGNEVSILTLFFHSNALFKKYFGIPIIRLSNLEKPKKVSIVEKIKLIFKIRKTLRRLKPDLIIGQLAVDCSILFFSTLFTKIIYATYIHGTIMWFPKDNSKYSLLHRKTMRRLRKRVIGHQQFYPETKKPLTLITAIGWEITAWIRYIGVRNAKTIFTLSERMADEILGLYHKKAIVLRGAYNANIFNHVNNHSIKTDLGLPNKNIILNINRLDSRKRVDLLIKAFSLAEKILRDTYLVIGGVGEEEDNLKNLVKNLGLSNVIFIGFVPEEKLLDYFATCDLFAHPNWADYAIAVYEALAMGQKVLCTTEMEFEPELLGYTQIFTAEPHVRVFSHALINALNFPNNNPIPKGLLDKYSWETYFKQIDNYLNSSTYPKNL